MHLAVNCSVTELMGNSSISASRIEMQHSLVALVGCQYSAYHAYQHIVKQ